MRKKSLKVITITTVIVALIQMLFLSSAVFAASSKTFNAAAEFSTKQDKNSTWQYLYNKGGSGYKNMPVYFKDWSAWRLVDDAKKGPYSNIYKTQDGKQMALHPDTEDGKPIDVAVAWKATADGKVTIPATIVGHHAYNNDPNDNGPKVWIEFKSKKYNETTIKKQGKATLKALTLTVKKGEKILFVVNHNGRGGDNETSWPISLTFTAKSKK